MNKVGSCSDTATLLQHWPRPKNWNSQKVMSASIGAHHVPDKLQAGPRGPLRQDRWAHLICSGPHNCHQHCIGRKKCYTISEWAEMGRGCSLVEEDNVRFPDFVWGKTEHLDATVVGFVPLQLIVLPHLRGLFKLLHKARKKWEAGQCLQDSMKRRASNFQKA